MKLTSKKLKQLILEVLAEAMPRAEQRLNDFMDAIQSEQGDSTVVIITAENPPAKVIDPQDPSNKGSFATINPGLNDKVINWDNDAMMAELEGDLQAKGLDYIEVQGEYFGPETSFMVFNMSKDDGIRLGKKYLQDAIVFGQKMKSTNLKDYDSDYQDPDYIGRDPESQMSAPAAGTPKIYFDFEMINLQTNHFSGKYHNNEPSPYDQYKVEETRNMIVAGANTQARTNLFTQAGGKKFVVPFYSSDSKHDTMSGDDLYNVRPVTETR